MHSPLFMLTIVIVLSALSVIYGYQLQLTSPCKINLFLRILGRRPTGYHDLASLFQAVSLADNMYFSMLSPTATQDELVCTDPLLTVTSDNLVIKAMNLMRNKTGIKQYFKIKLDKHIPIQAGLGGGSGNAATAMHAFNVLLNYPASLEQLRLWSGDIGSDITFFFSSGTAYCTGRGEIVNALPVLPSSDKTAVHIFKPKEGLSTPLVFKTLNLGKLSTVTPESLLKSYTTQGALEGAQAGYLINDLEPPAFQCQPQLEKLKETIKSLGKDSISGTMMSGSGTSVYALEGVDTPNPLPVERVLSLFPTVKHFKCQFISKKDDIYSWY